MKTIIHIYAIRNALKLGRNPRTPALTSIEGETGGKGRRGGGMWEGEGKVGRRGVRSKEEGEKEGAPLS